MFIKRLILTLILITSFLGSIRGQETDKNFGSIGLNYSSFGNNDLINIKDVWYRTRYNGVNYHAIGINYKYSLNTWLHIATGIEYANHKIEIIPEFEKAYNVDLNIFSVPANINIDFGKYFYLKGGVFLNIAGNNFERIDKQNGIGGVVGLGVKYNFDFGISISVNPFYRVNTLIPFSSEDFYQRMKVNGLRFGIMYKL